MKPAPFEYEAPDSLPGALELLERYGAEAKLLAGGQSLIPVMNFRLAQPAYLVDLKAVPDLDFIREADGGGVRIGALTRHRQLERDPLIARNAPLLSAAVPFIAHPQIRNRGTIGGTLAHADPAAELPAVAVALRARMRLQRTGGERWVPASEFFSGLFFTALEPEEILVEVEVPAMPARSGSSFVEIARRRGDYAQVGVAALVSLDRRGRCKEARLVYLSVGDTPIEARRAADLLRGKPISPAAVEAAAQAVDEEIEPAGDIHATVAFKRHLARVLTARALRQAAERAEKGG
ncbi:MAG: xanthine dehydrogenase family protein subunit M [bacterium]|nr:xanthine dehydrogenase family protein subunit M [bacterium]